MAFGLAGVALSYLGIWVLVTTWAAGLAWYESLSLAVSGPISALGGCVAWRAPRQRAASMLGVSGFVLWLCLWVLLTVFRFQIGGVRGA